MSAATPRARAARRRVAGHLLWMFDFDNTLAPLEPAVDWAASRRELQAWLSAQGVAAALFEEFPRGNLVLYEAVRARLCAGGNAARAVLAREGLAAALDGGQPGRDAIRRERGGGRAAAAPLAALLDGASAIIERYELAGVGSVAPAPGALELLRMLRSSGATVAIVTSNSSRTVTQFLRNCAGENKLHDEVDDEVDADNPLACVRVIDLVDFIVGRDNGLALKPSPATIEFALAACQCSLDDAAFVGDSEADLRAAQSAGVRFYGVNAKPEARERLTALGASPVFSSPAAMAVHLNLLSDRGRGR